jgi:hypothetical protein
MRDGVGIPGGPDAPVTILTQAMAIRHNGER